MSEEPEEGEPDAPPSAEDVAKLEEVMASLRALLEPSLGPGERIEAVAMGMRQRRIRATMNVVGVTGERLLLQPARPDRTPIGEADSFRPEEIEAFSFREGGDSFRKRSLLEQSTTIEILPVGERRFRLVMMRGGGSFFGAHGERAQAEQIEEIIAWLTARVGG